MITSKPLTEGWARFLPNNWEINYDSGELCLNNTPIATILEVEESFYLDTYTDDMKEHNKIDNVINKTLNISKLNVERNDRLQALEADYLQTQKDALQKLRIKDARKALRDD